MEFENIIYEKQGHVAIVKLNRPNVLNAMNKQLWLDFQAALDDVKQDSSIKVLIITGKGRAFSTGADLKESKTRSFEDYRDYLEELQEASKELIHFEKPTIAAINGYALGSGYELALACDIRIASATASMGLTETRLAIIPGAGGTQRLPRLIGRGKAKELIFTGRRVPAEEALAIGLVNQICAPDQLRKTCDAMAAEICETGPIAIEQAKYAINHGLETDLHTGLAIESNAYWVTIPTQDRLEGLAAFREKRKPVYKGE